LAFSLNFSTKITASPVTYGLVAGQATVYAALHAAYSAAYTAAVDPSTRTRSAIATKNNARSALKTNARLLAKVVEATATVTDAEKIDLGLNVRAQPSPIPAPSTAPALEIVSVIGLTVKIKLHDTSSDVRRGRPPGVQGASVFSFVGAASPADIAAWKFEGSTGRTTIDIAFDSSVAAGTKVWLTAFWCNAKLQSGPACAPVSANLPGGSVSMAA
jgi:hypothetical protein